MTSRPLPLISSLAFTHLRHEWIFTLCLVIALASVMAPLLVLLGLKNGTIQTLRHRLVEDPVFREIRPIQTREFSADWLEDLARRPGVGFLTPTILPLSSVLHVLPAGQGRAELFDLIPTAPGDPLLLENNGVIPEDGEVVLTAEAARRAGVGGGDTLRARVTRTRAGQTEMVEVPLRVAAVLASRAGTLSRVYAPLSFVLDVEAYKEGYGAPARGWPGEIPEPTPSYDGAVLLLDEPLPPIERTGLIINTGFGRIVEIDAARARELLGFALPKHFTIYELLAPGAAVTLTNLQAIDQKLRGRTRVLLPYAHNIRLVHEGREFSPIGLSLTDEQAALLGLQEPPWRTVGGSLPRERVLTRVLWPQGAFEPSEILMVQSAIDPELRFPLQYAGRASWERPVIPAELLGVLRTSQQRTVRFREETGRFELARGGYRGFRLYATSIDHVPELYDQLVGEGIEVTAAVQAIERIQVLDQGLTRLFRLIAMLGLLGGTAVLVASLYAAVERLRRELGMLRLLGFARKHVFCFPVVQGLGISGFGLLVALVAYLSLAGLINRAFASELAPGESFCILNTASFFIFAVVTFLLAGLASLAAAWRATRIDPAEVLRE